MGFRNGQACSYLRDGVAVADCSSEDEHLLIKKKSKLRQEIEDLLEQKGLVMERRISVMNLDSGEAHYFEDYAASLEFLKGKKGRWYITTPGLRVLQKRSLMPQIIFNRYSIRFITKIYKNHLFAFLGLLSPIFSAA